MAAVAAATVTALSSCYSLNANATLLVPAVTTLLLKSIALSKTKYYYYILHTLYDIIIIANYERDKLTSSNSMSLLKIFPESEISFVGPFDKVVTSHVELKNQNDFKVCYKVKTTAPRRYCVRPNSGLVDPNSTTKINIMLQPCQDSSEDKSKHKFMLQTFVVPKEHENSDLDTIWRFAPAKTIDTKLKCSFMYSSDAPKVTSTPQKLNPAASGASSKHESETKTTPISDSSKVESVHASETSNRDSSRKQHDYSRMSYKQEDASTSMQPTFIVAMLLVLIVGIIAGKYFF